MKIVVPCALALFGLLSAIPANAKGCAKGAVAGGVAGHVAGHHGAIGAAVGCAIGHHEANKNRTQNQNQNTAVRLRIEEIQLVRQIGIVRDAGQRCEGLLQRHFLEQCNRENL